jgi:hypothetical protein
MTTETRGGQHMQAAMMQAVSGYRLSAPASAVRSAKAQVVSTAALVRRQPRLGEFLPACIARGVANLPCVERGRRWWWQAALLAVCTLAWVAHHTASPPTSRLG